MFGNAVEFVAKHYNLDTSTPEGNELARSAATAINFLNLSAEELPETAVELRSMAPM